MMTMNDDDDDDDYEDDDGGDCVDYHRYRDKGDHETDHAPEENDNADDIGGNDNAMSRVRIRRYC